MDCIDVLIVGAGPTGLTMALECLRYGLSCRIIDQSAEATTFSKAIVIQARTLEVFQRIGIHEKFLKEGLQLKAGNLQSGKRKRARFPLQTIDSPFPFVLSIEQSKTERILDESLKELGGKIERLTSLISFEEKDGVIFAKTDKEVIQAKYLVGCDGAHSIVRKTLGCSFKGKMFSDIFSLADVKIQWERPHDELYVFLESKGIFSAIPLPEKDRYRVIFQLKRLRGLLSKNLTIRHGIIDSKEIKPPTMAEIGEILSLYTNGKGAVSDPRWIANFHINSRLSNRYQKNNVFLAGDAAHIHSPVGGQGMNTGIQDAFNLAWKIAYVHKHSFSNSLLNSYEKERHELGVKLLKYTERASTMLTLHSKPLLLIRNTLLFSLIPLKFIQRKLANTISQINIHYRFARMSNLTLINNGEEVDYFTLTEKSNQFHLLLFNVDESPIEHPQIVSYHVKGTGSPKIILVRPDGYIALEDRPPFVKLRKNFLKIELA